jgi:transcriptional regulator with XRE-family HTH domain
MKMISPNGQQALATLGARLREIRSDAGLTGRDLARRAGWHSSKVSKIEYGRQVPTAADITTWCVHCNADANAVDLIASLRAMDGMFVEWRRLHRSGLLREQHRRQTVWERATRVCGYTSDVMPGPLQVQAYVRAILTAIRNHRELPHDDVEAAVAARLDRQQLLHQPELRMVVVVEETVLHNSIGGADIMAAQLGHLLTVSTLPTISLGIIPQKADRSTSWPVESFWIFDDNEVALELVSGRLTVTHPQEIGEYLKVFGLLQLLNH